MTARTLRDRLAAGPVVLDGGLSTALEAAGHDLADPLWTARALRDEPEAVEAAHRAYVDAGAEVIITASYQAGPDAPELLRASVEAARRAAAGRALVAASVGPYGAVLAGGQEYTGDYGTLRPGRLEAFHAARLRVLLDAGPDCVACETIPRADEGALLARLLDELGAPDAWVSFACRDGRSTAHGEPIEAAVEAVAGAKALTAVGVNCTAPEHLEELLRRIGTVTDLPLVAYPNAGRTWDAEAKRWHAASAAATLPPSLVRAWAAEGARLVGGCCGLGPEAVAGIAAALPLSGSGA